MDVQKNGQSSCQPISSTSSAADAGLILPEWDSVPRKHLHSSLDLITLLHLDGLYNTYVRPYFDPVPETDDEGPTAAVGAARKQAQRKKQGLSKGYVGLLEDCIDPVPMGNQAEHSLLPLAGEWIDPPRPPPTLDPPAGPIPLLSAEVLASARLEAGLKHDGYANGEKLGVREAEEKRRRKKQARLSASVAPDFPPDHLPSPGPSGSFAGPGAGPSNVGVAPPMRGGRAFTVRGRGAAPGGGGGSSNRPPWPRASAPPTSGRYVPSGSSGAGPGTPSRRPGAAPGTPSSMSHPHTTQHTPTSHGQKRPGEGYPPSLKRARGLTGTGHSRSASPADHGVGVKAVFKGGMRRTEEP